MWKKTFVPVFLLAHAAGQTPIVDPGSNSTESSYDRASGTLNLVLANRNGFVVATDSRMTFSGSGASLDTSQKLFRTGPKSALAIAGFASAGGPPPFQFELAAEINKAFAKVRTSHVEWGILVTQLRSAVEFKLNILRSLQPDKSPEGLKFFGTFAFFDEASIPTIAKLTFSPSVKGPWQQIEAGEWHADHFQAVAVGGTAIADAILDGRSTGGGQPIQDYTAARSAGQLDSLTVAQLKALAAAILEETKKADRFVGGPTQIGVFPTRGAVKWTQQKFPPQRAMITSNSFVRMTFGGGVAGAGDRNHTTVFIRSTFHDAGVVLDGNTFVNDLFRNCILSETSRPLLFVGNHCEDSSLRVSAEGKVKVFLLSPRCDRSRELKP